MLLLQPLILATLAVAASALACVAILRLMRAQAGRTTPSAWRGELLARTLRTDDAAMPAWVHRLRADGLPGRGISSGAPSRPVSQRFIDRWDGVTSGY
jgi:hypothetical protein